MCIQASSVCVSQWKALDVNMSDKMLDSGIFRSVPVGATGFQLQASEHSYVNRTVRNVIQGILNVEHFGALTFKLKNAQV